MKGKQTKKITLSISILAVVTAIITIIALLVNTQTQKTKLLADPEIQKSMEYEQVQEGDEKVPNTDYVQFDAFFLRDLDGDGYAEQVRGMCRDINKTDTLYMNLNVLTNGKLVDGKITIKTSNINLSTAIVEDNVIKQNYISNNTTEIALKDVNNGTQKLIYGTVNASNFVNDTNKYSQVNSVVLTGTHIADDGTRTQISKTVDFNVDWYGTVTASIYNYTGTQNIEEITDENKENITLNFSVTTRETTDDLILKKAVLEGTIPTIIPGVSVCSPAGPRCSLPYADAIAAGMRPAGAFFAALHSKQPLPCHCGSLPGPAVLLSAYQRDSKSGDAHLSPQREQQPPAGPGGVRCALCGIRCGFCRPVRTLCPSGGSDSHRCPDDLYRERRTLL